CTQCCASYRTLSIYPIKTSARMPAFFLICVRFMASISSNDDTMAEQLILKFSCQDQPGIVASVASLFSLQGFNIRESSQFEDIHTRQFFMRTVLESVEGPKKMADIKSAFSAVAKRYGMNWEIYDGAYKPRMVIA